jgi:hypothetical protein
MRTQRGWVDSTINVYGHKNFLKYEANKLQPDSLVAATRLYENCKAALPKWNNYAGNTVKYMLDQFEVWTGVPFPMVERARKVRVSLL